MWYCFPNEWAYLKRTEELMLKSLTVRGHTERQDSASPQQIPVSLHPHGGIQRWQCDLCGWWSRKHGAAVEPESLSAAVRQPCLERLRRSTTGRFDLTHFAPNQRNDFRILFGKEYFIFPSHSFYISSYLNLPPAGASSLLSSSVFCQWLNQSRYRR